MFEVEENQPKPGDQFITVDGDELRIESVMVIDEAKDRVLVKCEDGLLYWVDGQEQGDFYGYLAEVPPAEETKP